MDLPIALPGEDEDEIFLTPEDDVIVWKNVKGALNEFVFSPSEPPCYDETFTVLDYNGVKSYIDVSDKLASYGTGVRRGYSFSTDGHCSISGKSCNLFSCENNENARENAPNNRGGAHKLTELPYFRRGRYQSYYKRLSATLGRNEAPGKCLQVKTFCAGCPQQKCTCKIVFSKAYRSSSKY
ncbi:hypothetical protein J6590_093507 [Homalodisca vitripennis]|nr:hypothetical protein J6590_093507 [Homalodisca vitripennis]